jgi:hypothetical protein
MNQSMQSLSADAFFASLRDRTAHGVCTVTLDGGELPVSVHLEDSSTVVFSFAGAVDRSTNTLPHFAATSIHEYIPASVIALSDPSLALSEDLKLAWYAGHEGFDLQQVLPDFFRRVIDCLAATRVAFVGTSGGGFAALYYSWQVPGSLAVVTNPQTNLNRAIRAHREKYRAICWPSLEDDAPLSAAIDVDLCSLYGKRCPNTVIYLQEATDFFHLRWHFGPWVARLPRESAARLVVRMASWAEKRGHQPVPAKIWVPWMTAALSAPVMTAHSIEETWSRENPARIRPLKSRQPSTPAVRIPNRDEQIAAELSRIATDAVFGQQSNEVHSW